MTRRVAYQGAKLTIAFAREKSGACPAWEFFDALGLLEKAKLMALFRIAGDHASFCNDQKFGVLGDGLFEFKSFQIRMPFAYARKERGLVLVTHGFVKKKNRTPKEEIERAWRILGEDKADRIRLTVVKKAKQ